MKVEMCGDGTLVIGADNGCERFALREWCERVEWNAAIESGIRLTVDTGDAIKVRDEDRPEPLRDRLARAERALKRAGFTYTEGAQEWKPPIGRYREVEKPVYVVYHGADGTGYANDSVCGNRQFAMAAHDGASIIVEQEPEVIRVSVAASSKRVEPPNRKSDISAASDAIVEIVKPHCPAWGEWPGAMALATAAYDAIYANVERRS